MTPQQLTTLKELSLQTQNDNPDSNGDIIVNPEEASLVNEHGLPAYFDVRKIDEAYLDGAFLYYRVHGSGRWLSAGIEGMTDLMLCLNLYDEHTGLETMDYVIKPDGSFVRIGDMYSLTTQAYVKRISELLSISTCSLEPKDR